MESKDGVDDSPEDREAYRKMIRNQFTVLDQLREKVFERGNVYELAAFFAITFEAVIATKGITFPVEPEKMELSKRIPNSMFN